jgi:hypothetical protein
VAGFETPMKLAFDSAARVALFRVQVGTGHRVNRHPETAVPLSASE